MASQSPRGPRPRTRTQGLITPLPWRTTGGGLTPTYTVAYDVTYLSVGSSGNLKTTSDVVTPGWREIVKSGGRINNPFDSYVVRQTPYNSSHYRTWAYPGGTAWETCSGPTVTRIFGGLTDPGTLTLDTNGIQTAATIQAWANVGEPDTLAWVTALESHKSVQMIVERARSLAKVVQACRSGNWAAVEKALGRRIERRAPPRKFAVWDGDGKPLLTPRGSSRYARSDLTYVSDPSLLDQASRLWCESRFGWRPLVYDIISSLKALYAADLRRDLLPVTVHTARGKGYGEKSVTTAITGSTNGLSYTGTRTSKVEYGVRTYIHYSWSQPDGMLRRMNDFGLFSIPVTLWELVPFSFMVDRIAPVGQWLSALTPKVGVNVLDAGHSISRKASTEQTLTGPASQVVGGVSYPPACPIGSKDQAEFASLIRKTFLDLPAYPPIDVKIDLPKLADVFALWRALR